MRKTYTCCPDREQVNEVFRTITQKSNTPIPIGTRCESFTFYRVQDLDDDALDLCACYVAHQIHDKLEPYHPELFLKLPGGYSFFAERLATIYNDLWSGGEDIPFEQFIDSKFTNGYAESFRGKRAILLTDVITTARSSLEAHTKATIKGIKVVSWATLIDRTLGPGPVSVVSAITGEPVRMLNTVSY